MGEGRLISKAGAKTRTEQGGRVKLLLDNCIPLGITLNFTEPHL